MEEWDFVDDRDLQGWKGGVVCMTCQHFAYGVDRHCHTLLTCNLRRRQLAQGDHLKKRCKLWAPTWRAEAGCAPEAGYLVSQASASSSSSSISRPFSLLSMSWL